MEPVWGRAIMVQAPGVPVDSDWAEYIADFERTPYESVLIIAGESKLTPKQRADVQRLQERYVVKAVLVTDSIAARGVMTALQWFGVKVAGFASRDLGRALEAVGVLASRHAEARALLERLAASLEEQRNKQSEVPG